MELLFAALEALQEAGLPTALRLSNLAYPLVNAAHIMGLALLFGAIVAFDLRALGLWPSVPLAPLARILVTVSAIGFAVAVATGALLFSVRAVKYAGIGVFQLKLLLIAAAIMNVIMLHRSAAWQELRRKGGQRPSPRLRGQALISIALWSGVILCGRMIAYSA